MKLKICAAAIIFSLLLTSCDKNDNTGTTGTGSVPEKTMSNVAYGTDPLQKMDIYLPANRSTATTKVMILIHGGGWISGDKADFAPNMDTLKKRIPDYAIFNLNYRFTLSVINLWQWEPVPEDTFHYYSHINIQARLR